MDEPRGLRFEWDPAKAQANLKKHGISFEEAQTVFDDPFASINADEKHDWDEPRETIVGMSKRRRLLFVSFIEPRARLIRIISARKATPQERRKNEEAS